MPSTAPTSLAVIAPLLNDCTRSSSDCASRIDPSASRAEQLRGLFDTARQDAANAPLPAQEDAAEEATRNA